MSVSLTVKAEPISSTSFQEFGDVIQASGLRTMSSNAGKGTTEVFRAGPIDCDHPAEFLLVRLGLREFRVRYLERHREISQTFIPMNGRPYLVAVAPVGASLKNGAPDPESIRAFTIPSDVAVRLHRGTWHEPPLALSDGTLILMTSHQELSLGLEAERDANGEINDFDVDRRNVPNRTNATIEIDPG